MILRLDIYVHGLLEWGGTYQTQKLIGVEIPNSTVIASISTGVYPAAHRKIDY